MKYGIYGKYNNKIKGTMFSSVQLRRLIYPLIIEQILAITVGMVDTVMISYVGEAAVSGVSLVDMINNLLINIFAAIATGGAVVISQYLGNKDKTKASRAATQLITVAIVIAVGNAIMIFGLSMGVAGAALSTFISRVLGAIGVWIAMVLDWIFRCALFTWRFVQGKWLEYKVI